MAVVDPAATRALVLFSLSMIALPLVSLFASHHVFSRVFDISNSSSYIYGAIVAVVTVHIVLLCFVLHAFSDSKKDTQTKSD
ncbi:unnamed protein product [Dicrocoelium dendriticum]|nr:unnamed protein product [Dicrocoelium dendriticum]